MTKILKSTDLEYFQQKGYLRIPEAFSPLEALVMQNFIWEKLEEKSNILRSDPNSWNKKLPGSINLLGMRFIVISPANECAMSLMIY